MIGKLKPVLTPWSSVVGGGIQLVDYKGQTKFMVMICGTTDGITKEQNDEICAKIMDGWKS